MTVGKLVVTEFVTVDGVFEDPGGSENFERGGWAFEFERGDDGDKFNSMPKYVVSTTLENPEWQNTTVLDSEDPAAAIRRLKEEIDGTILVAGGAKLLKFLLDEGLVDELRLMVFPVVLGKGRRLFLDHTAKNPLELVELKPVGDDGVVVQIYRPRS